MTSSNVKSLGMLLELYVLLLKWPLVLGINHYFDTYTFNIHSQLLNNVKKCMTSSKRIVMYKVTLGFFPWVYLSFIRSLERIGLNNLKSKVDKLNIGKLETTQVHLSKLSNVVKQTEYYELVKKVNNINTTDTSTKKLTTTQKLIK